MQFMYRWGRIVRGVLQNRRRKVRDDVQGVTRNYVAQVGRRVPGAPIANVFLSAYNAFADNLIVGEAPRRRCDVLDPHANPGAVPEADRAGTVQRGFAPQHPTSDLLYEELTTSVLHRATDHASVLDGLVPGGVDDVYGDEDVEDDYEDDEEEEEDEAGIRPSLVTLGSAFPQSVGWSLALPRTPGAPGVGSVRPIGLETLRLIEELMDRDDFQDEAPPNKKACI
jgi:hypothetical protein